ncbi:MAG TPA: CrcB family protein [Solirubrobacteraceae bacterium]|jgi:CrcB protein|nr:CrcB family protein [Solirubrobacteraceae bacterium]
MRGGADRRQLAALALGGAAGALLRVWIAHRVGGAGGGWPWATFSINVSGALLLGYITAGPPGSLLAISFCGAFTTFATMQVEILAMLERHDYGLAVAYGLGSAAAGYLAVRVTAAARRRPVAT